MKVALLGPITTENYYGGVAVFNEEIAKGFVANGWEAVCMTNQKEAENILTKNGVDICFINRKNAKNIFFKQNPDIIIASLDYAKLLKRCKTNTKKIYFLHGFFNQSYYGKIKAELAVLYQKSLIDQCDMVFANSQFTKMINEEFFGIKSNMVFHLGVSNTYYTLLSKATIKKVSHTILYAGRLVSAKGIDLLIEALKILKGKDIEYQVFIAGTGPEEPRIKEIAKESNLPISFLGRLSQENLLEYYIKSEVFVSLNPSEPFGIVFVEALLAQCKILCPITGGQIEYLKDYGDSIFFVTEQSAECISNGLESLLYSPSPPILCKSQLETFTYKKVAQQMIRYLEKNCD